MYRVGVIGDNGELVLYITGAAVSKLKLGMYPFLVMCAIMNGNVAVTDDVIVIYDVTANIT